MNVRPSTRRKAVLGIFQIRRKRKGGRLSARELERAWRPTTGLRRADLQLALLDMAEHQLLAPHETANGLVFELTWHGEQTMLKSGPRHSFQDLGDWITLLRARIRKSRRSEAGPRRSGDHAAAH